ncbi:hypothetical protein [Microvirga calopogonii]|uniref:hypothetical protein n=1 Tax=Microvirga calopogonii TaxID=2078013 RepID=UPI000E0D466E|nr:hypothetical protein [Microvirga calopogonii]
MSGEHHQRSSLGDLLQPNSELSARKVLAEGHEAPEPDKLIAMLARRYEATVEQLSTELKGTSVLARIARDLLNLPEPGERRGRPPKTDESWAEFVLIETLRHHGLSANKAIDKVAELTVASDEDETATARIKKRYQRSSRKWGAASVPKTISEMFGPTPESKGEDKKKV